MDEQGRRWTVQWHITADGTVIRQRSRGEAEHQQVYAEHATTRPVQVGDLERIDERVARFGAFWGRVTTVLLGLLVVCGAGLVVGIVLAWSGRSDIALPLLVVSVVALVLLFCVGGYATHRVRVGVPRIYGEAGVEPGGVTMNARDARARISAAGTVSGAPRQLANA